MVNWYIIHHRDCVLMEAVPAEQIALTVTSPPYWNAIEYDTHVQGKGEDYRKRVNRISYNTFFNVWLRERFQEVYRKTRPGGFCAVVIGTVLDQGVHYALPFDFTVMMTSMGWQFWQDIVWHKCTAGVKRARVFIQHPRPGYYYPNIMTEYIMVFRKDGPKIFDLPGARDYDELEVDSLFKQEIANNVWHIAPVPPNQVDHPCPFPEEIPHRLIRLYTHENDWILDPFCGSGQTGKAAKDLERNFVGYDVEQKYVDLATRRIAEPSGIRPQQLMASFQKINRIEGGF